MNITKREKTGLIIFIIILLGIISYNYFSKSKNSIEVITNQKQPIVSEAAKTSPAAAVESEVKKVNAEKQISVYICGEVLKPGVYTMKEGDRVKALLDAAGGFTPNADPNVVNLSARIQDEEKIRIPSKNENITEQSDQNTAGIKGKININSATKEQLETLDRIGSTLAQRIIDYRNAHGRFKTIEELKNVSGIGDKTFEHFKDNISVN